MIKAKTKMERKREKKRVQSFRKVSSANFSFFKRDKGGEKEKRICTKNLGGEKKKK